MGRSGQRQCWAVARGVVLAAVLTGLFAMHVLTGEGAGSGHGVMPMMGVASHGGSAGHDPSMAGTAAVMGEPVSDPSSSVDAVWSQEAAAAAVGPVDPGPGTGHAAMVGCVLFLVLGGAALSLVLLRHRGPLAAAGLGRLTAAGWTDLRRRGPPLGWPRVCLSVIRV